MKNTRELYELDDFSKKEVTDYSLNYWHNNLAAFGLDFEQKV